MKTCELCQATIPMAEYGVMMPQEHWEQIAPRPDGEFFGSGLLCFDCQDQRLRERLGITLQDALNDGGDISAYAPPTDRMRQLIDEETLAEMDEEFDPHGA